VREDLVDGRHREEDGGLVQGRQRTGAQE
jgi:hypothetical protein